jgi:FkbM family methyltransferase
MNLGRLRRRVAEAFGSDRYSHLALNDLDRKLSRYLDYRDGFFVEAGANDGLSQSNTYWFERFRGWRGVLVEGVPELAAACQRNRPGCVVLNSALVADGSITQVTMKTASLMSVVAGAFGSVEAEERHLQRGVAVQGLQPGAVGEVTVAARTLTSILEDVAPSRFDLLSLDVEGYEPQALKGLDLRRFSPRFILVEARSLSEMDELLQPMYRRVDQLSHHDYLYSLADPARVI